jgi:hypothetical protein
MNGPKSRQGGKRYVRECDYDLGGRKVEAQTQSSHCAEEAGRSAQDRASLWYTCAVEDVQLGSLLSSRVLVGRWAIMHSAIARVEQSGEKSSRVEARYVRKHWSMRRARVPRCFGPALATSTDALAATQCQVFLYGRTIHVDRQGRAGGVDGASPGASTEMMVNGQEKQRTPVKRKAPKSEYSKTSTSRTSETREKQTRHPGPARSQLHPPRFVFPLGFLSYSLPLRRLLSNTAISCAQLAPRPHAAFSPRTLRCCCSRRLGILGPQHVCAVFRPVSCDYLMRKSRKRLSDHP